MYPNSNLYLYDEICSFPALVRALNIHVALTSNTTRLYALAHFAVNCVSRHGTLMNNPDLDLPK